MTGPRLSVRFAWYEAWVGVFYDRAWRTFYVCPLPMVCITYHRRPPRHSS